MARPLRHLQFDEPPEGMPGQPKPGEVTALSIRSRRDGFSVKEAIRSHLDFVSPCFMVLAPSRGV